MQKSSNECVCIADTYSRSIKFIQCLAGGISIVSHQWIIECCRQNRILDRESYILPAGYSIITNALSSDKYGELILLFLQFLLIIFFFKKKEYIQTKFGSI